MFIFQFFNNKTHNYVSFNTFVHFNIQKLKNKHTFLKKYTNWESWGISHFDRTRGEKNQIFPTWNTSALVWRALTCSFNCQWALLLYSHLSQFKTNPEFLFLGQNVGLKSNDFKWFRYDTMHTVITRLNLKKMGSLQFCLPSLLGTHWHPKQKEFLKSCEGLLRAALTGHSHTSLF